MCPASFSATPSAIAVCHAATCVPCRPPNLKTLWEKEEVGLRMCRVDGERAISMFCWRLPLHSECGANSMHWRVACVFSRTSAQ